jgi:hypothetical protein
MTVGWGCRTLRAGVFAAVCVLLAALGHVTMSGSSVPWWALAAGAVGTGGVGWSLAGRERGHALIVTIVVVAQAILHETFSLGQSAAASTNMGSMNMGSMDTGSMRMDAMDMAGMGHMGSGSTRHLGHGMGGNASFGMLAAHLLAAVLCGLWLAYGERAVFRILRAAATRLAAPLRMLLALPVLPRRPSVRVRRDSSRQSLSRLLLSHAITSRGPPTGTAVI